MLRRSGLCDRSKDALGPRYRGALGIGLIALLPFVTATTCSTDTVIAVTPTGSTDELNATDSAVALVSRVVARRGFESHDRGYNDEGWAGCVVKENVWLCRRATEREAQFLFYQTGTTRFAPWADSLRHEMLDSLRARFGEQQVHECESREECNPKPS